MLATVPSVPVARLDSLTSLRWWTAFAVSLFYMRNMVTLSAVVAVVR